MPSSLAIRKHNLYLTYQQDVSLLEQEYMPIKDINAPRLTPMRRRHIDLAITYLATEMLHYSDKDKLPTSVDAMRYAATQDESIEDAYAWGSKVVKYSCYWFHERLASEDVSTLPLVQMALSEEHLDVSDFASRRSVSKHLTRFTYFMKQALKSQKIKEIEKLNKDLVAYKASATKRIETFEFQTKTNKQNLIDIYQITTQDKVKDLLDQGMKSKDIAQILNLTPARISQIKKQLKEL